MSTETWWANNKISKEWWDKNKERLGLAFFRQLKELGKS